MLSLDDPRWRELSDAYGPAAAIPRLLKESLYEELFSHLCHQGDIYTASYAALPHLVQRLTTPNDAFAWQVAALIDGVESARIAGRGPELPAYLAEPYFAALKQVPALAGRLLTSVRSELECRSLLAVTAATCGMADLARAIGEMTPEVVQNIARSGLEEMALEAASRKLHDRGRHHGWWRSKGSFDELDPIGRDELTNLTWSVIDTYAKALPGAQKKTNKS